MAIRKHYFSNQVDEDVEDITIKLIEIARKEHMLVSNKMKSTLSLVFLFSSLKRTYK